jgi:hypothetical protein
MYPRNNATPPRLTIGQVIQISDGAVQTSGVSVTTRGDGASEVAGSGTIEYGADGTVYYTPTQAETDYESFSLIANKASCFSCSVTVVTSASSTSGVASADVTQISGDSVAADNLELQYDGTGLDGDSFPARQSQVSDIAVTGAAINATYDSWTGTTGGVVSGTPDSTVARDGVYYQINDAAGIIDQEVEFDIGSDGVPTGVTFFGYLNGGNDNIQIQAYDWNTLQFRTLGTVNGNNGSSAFELNFALFTSMVGSGADEGRVIVKFYNATLTNANLYIDQLYCSYAVVNRSVGYSQGAIWVDTLGSNTGAVPFIDGTADNKVNSYANAKTIAAAVDLNKYEFSPLNSITIDQSHAADAFFGSNYALNLNNQAPPTLVQGAEVTGIANGTASHYIRESRVGTIATPLTANSGLVCELCGIVNVQLKDQAGAALDVEFLDCHGNTQGSMFPGGTVDFGTTAGTNHEVAFQRWGGPVTLKNMKDGDTVYFHGNGTAILDATCTGGSFRVAGMINLVDNSGGAVSILEDGRITKSGVAAEVWDTVLSNHLTEGSTGEALYLNSSRISGLLTGVWKWDTGTTASDPGAGKVRADSSTYPSITSIYINEETDNAENASIVLSSLAIGDVIKIGKTDDGTKFLTASVSGAPTDNGGWWTVPVSIADSGSSIGSGNKVNCSFLLSSGSGGDDAATIYTYFTTSNREDAFHADVSGLATPADVNAQMLDVFTVDTFAEPSSVPPATSTLVDMIHWNFTVARNKLEQTSTTTTLRNDADSANIATSTVSDNGSTFTRGEYS